MTAKLQAVPGQLEAAKQQLTSLAAQLEAAKQQLAQEKTAFKQLTADSEVNCRCPYNLFQIQMSAHF